MDDLDEGLDEVTESADPFHGAYKETSLKINAVPTEPSHIAILNSPAGRLLSGKHAHSRRSKSHGVSDHRTLDHDTEQSEKPTRDGFLEYHRPPTRWSAPHEQHTEGATVTGEDLFVSVHRELGIDNIGKSERGVPEDAAEETAGWQPSERVSEGKSRERVSFARRSSLPNETAKHKPLLLEDPTGSQEEPKPATLQFKQEPGEITEEGDSNLPQIRASVMAPEPSTSEINVRGERVLLLQKVTRSMGKTGTTIYNSVTPFLSRA